MMCLCEGEGCVFMVDRGAWGDQRKTMDPGTGVIDDCEPSGVCTELMFSRKAIYALNC